MQGGTLVVVPHDQPVSPSGDAVLRAESSSWGGACFVAHWSAAQVVSGCSSLLPVVSCLF